jgi:signal transduction histidine kinase
VISDGSITFPDLPQVQFNRLLTELGEREDEVSSTRGRLRALLRANHAVVERLDLPLVLRRIVEVAVDLAGAEYGALEVVSPEGERETFVQVGMNPVQVAAMGRVPDGRGLSGALIDDPRPIRLSDVGGDPRSVGLPPGHPPVRSFLRVPVAVRNEVFGNLYLANARSGQFGEDDEQLVSSLASSAGFAIDNAHLAADSRRRQAWSGASAEITATLLGDEDVDSIPLLLDRVLQLSDADTACLIRPTEDPALLRVEAARGASMSRLLGLPIPADTSLAGRVLRSGQPLLTGPTEAETDIQRSLGLGAVMAVPFLLDGQSVGALVLARTLGRPRFTPDELEMAADFAGQVSVVLELARGRADLHRMILLEDRGRIARDLHDHVIQQLFATGLSLQSVVGSVPAGPVAERIGRSVADLDTAIAQIRTAIFALSSPSEGAPTLRHRIIDVVNELASVMPRTPALTFQGAVDLRLDGALADDVVAVVRELLTNVVKHAVANSASVTVAVDDDGVVITVGDDGSGAAAASMVEALLTGPVTGVASADGSEHDETDPVLRGSGLVNLEERASRRGGSFSFTSAPGGTRAEWRVPLPPAGRPG